MTATLITRAELDAMPRTPGTCAYCSRDTMVYALVLFTCRKCVLDDMDAHGEPGKLTRAEAAYAHLASFAKGAQVIVTGLHYALEGTVTTPRQDARSMRRSYLTVTGTGTFEDGEGGWEQRPVDCVITVDKMLSRGCLTLATKADAASGKWEYFDAATWAMRNAAV